jgi:toxin HigB-1
MRYYTGMIKGFADKETERLWKGRRSKAVPEQLREKAVAKLLSVDIANNVQELEVPPSNRLHKLGGDRQGQWSISINMQYRVCFRFEGGDAYEVEVTDYH